MDPTKYASTDAGAPIQVRGPAPYWAYAPAPCLRAVVMSPDVILALSKADQALGRLIGVGQVLPNPHLVSAAYRRREAISSLAIEGTQTSLSAVLTSEAVDIAGSTEVVEVRNYLRAFDHGIARLSELPMSLRLIREIHSVLMQGVRGRERTPGEFRTSQNWIGREGTSIESALYVPPPPDLMKDALADWEVYLHEEGSSLPPLVKCALIHSQFETIHPFLDGNGRIGRLLIAFYLVERSILPEPLLYISPYFEARRPDYYELLQGVRERGEFGPWLMFFFDAVCSQAIDAAQRAEKLLAILEEFKERLRQGKARGRSPQLVEQLIANPFMTTTRAATFLGVTSQGAAYVIAQLVEFGILTPGVTVGRARVFVAEQVLDTLEGDSS